MDEPLTAAEYDLEAVYDAKIAPLMTQIIAICKRHELPMIASFAYRAGSYCSTALHFNDRPVKRFERMQAVMFAGTNAAEMIEKE